MQVRMTARPTSGPCHVSEGTHNMQLCIILPALPCSSPAPLSSALLSTVRLCALVGLAMSVAMP